jgi:glycosyltransferase involved in cell wall biosynthesis
VRRFHPDVVAVHTSAAHHWAVGLDAPVVVHRRLDFALNRRSRWRVRRAAGVVAVSQAVRHVLRGAAVADDRIRVVYDGVPPPADDVAERRATVLAVGALVPHKGHATLVRAAAITGRPVEIAGDGPLRASLEALASRLSAPVTWLGACDDVPRRLRACGVFCHPSVEEGLGQAVLEARAAGCRTVASRVGGIPEATGPAALLVPPNRPDLLAEAIETAFQRPPPAPERPDAMRSETLRERTHAAYASLLGSR